MAKKKEAYKVKQLNENKKNIIAALIDEYDIETADDIQEALKDLLGGTIKSMMEAEMDEHLGYERYERNDGDNYRNGTKSKKVRSCKCQYKNAQKLENKNVHFPAIPLSGFLQRLACLSSGMTVL